MWRRYDCCLAMAKILISFLGTGRVDGKDKSKRRYEPTTYKLGEYSGDYTFMAKMLAEKECVDTVFLIGTRHSMWEEVYYSFSEKNVDEEKLWEIAKDCDAANSKTSLDFPYKTEIEKAVSNPELRILMVHYGINEQEIKENIEIVLGIVEHLRDNDEIIVDITHSFRSIPLIIMNLLFYLRTLRNPKVIISHIYYGMLEVTRELGYTPVVDLKSALEITDWTLGAYSFHQFGISDQICGLVTDKEVSSSLERFSSLLSLNFLEPLEKEAQRLSGLKNHKYDSLLESMTVKPVVEDFVKTFGGEKVHYAFQYKLAKWQFDKFNFLASMATLLEATVTYASEVNGLDWRDYDSRNYCKEMLRKGRGEKGVVLDQDLLAVYNAINGKRNNLVHQNATSKNPSYEVYVKAIKDNLKVFGRLVKARGV